MDFFRLAPENNIHKTPNQSGRKQSTSKNRNEAIGGPQKWSVIAVLHTLQEEHALLTAPWDNCKFNEIKNHA